MTRATIKGQAWHFGDEIDTDIIAPAKYLAAPDARGWAEHIMEPVDPDFPRKIHPGDIIVAGENFGYGSSREHAAIALRVAGVGAVIADSVARVFYRNAINNGLTVLECPGASSRIDQGDQLEIDLSNGEIRNLTRAYVLKFVKMPDFLLDMLDLGGLLAYLQKGAHAKERSD